MPFGDSDWVAAAHWAALVDLVKAFHHLDVSCFPKLGPALIMEHVSADKTAAMLSCFITVPTDETLDLIVGENFHIGWTSWGPLINTWEGSLS